VRQLIATVTDELFGHEQLLYIGLALLGLARVLGDACKFRQHTLSKSHDPVQWIHGTSMNVVTVFQASHNYAHHRFGSIRKTTSLYAPEVRQFPLFDDRHFDTLDSPRQRHVAIQMRIQLTFELFREIVQVIARIARESELQCTRHTSHGPISALACQQSGNSRSVTKWHGAIVKVIHVAFREDHQWLTLILQHIDRSAKCANIVDLTVDAKTAVTFQYATSDEMRRAENLPGGHEKKWVAETVGGHEQCERICMARMIGSNQHTAALTKGAANMIDPLNVNFFQAVMFSGTALAQRPENPSPHAAGAGMPAGRFRAV